MKKILQKDEKVLRQIAKEVPLADIHTTKIKKGIGWEAKITLEEGIKRMAEYYKQHRKNYW